LASESARQQKAHGGQAGGGGAASYLNWYAADFNEELSALDGALLHSQTAFVVTAVRQLLASTKAARGLVVVGHSMGGVVGQAAATLPACVQWRARQETGVEVGAEEGVVDAGKDGGEGCVRTIVTLGAPHARLPFVAQPATASFYGELRRAWSGEPESLPHVAVAAITAGERDFQVTVVTCWEPGSQPAIERTTEQLTTRRRAWDLPQVQWTHAESDHLNASGRWFSSSTLAMPGT
jgi:pimeloyl-ACP methyl ester carboxylesterase